MLKQIRQISRKQPEEYNFTLAELHLLQIKTTQAGIKPLKDRVTRFLIVVFLRIIFSRALSVISNFFITDILMTKI
jgi:hypothetical protein